jgi:hypothetical protein
LGGKRFRSLALGAVADVHQVQWSFNVSLKTSDPFN